MWHTFIKLSCLLDGACICTHVLHFFHHLKSQWTKKLVRYANVIHCLFLDNMYPHVEQNHFFYPSWVFIWMSQMLKGSAFSSTMRIRKEILILSDIVTYFDWFLLSHFCRCLYPIIGRFMAANTQVYIPKVALREANTTFIKWSSPSIIWLH